MKIVDKLNKILPSALVIIALILASLGAFDKAIVCLLCVCATELIRIKK